MIVEALSISPEIEAVIDSDIRKGNADRIDRILANPRTAIILYLEGKITRKDIEQSEVDEQSVTFAGISFATENGKMILPVVVMAEPEYSIATLDKDGNVV